MERSRAKGPSEILPVRVGARPASRSKSAGTSFLSFFFLRRPRWHACRQLHPTCRATPVGISRSLALFPSLALSLSILPRATEQRAFVFDPRCRSFSYICARADRQPVRSAGADCVIPPADPSLSAGRVTASRRAARSQLVLQQLVTARNDFPLFFSRLASHRRCQGRRINTITFDAAENLDGDAE